MIQGISYAALSPVLIVAVAALTWATRKKTGA